MDLHHVHETWSVVLESFPIFGIDNRFKISTVYRYRVDNYGQRLPGIVPYETQYLFT